MNERTLCVFSFCQDSNLEAEIIDRIRSLPSYEDGPDIEFVSLVNGVADNLKPVASFVFVLSILILFLEGKYCQTSVKAHLKNAQYSVLRETLVNRLKVLVNKNWK